MCSDIGPAGGDSGAGGDEDEGTRAVANHEFAGWGGDFEGIALGEGGELRGECAAGDEAVEDLDVVILFAAGDGIVAVFVECAPVNGEELASAEVEAFAAQCEFKRGGREGAVAQNARLPSADFLCGLFGFL